MQFPGFSLVFVDFFQFLKKITYKIIEPNKIVHIRKNTLVYLNILKN